MTDAAELEAPAKPECPACVDAERKGYCALGRCYCGHEVCAAFASWAPLPKLAGNAPAPGAPARASSWDDRQGDTWIDKL